MCSAVSAGALEKQEDFTGKRIAINIAITMHEKNGNSRAIIFPGTWRLVWLLCPVFVRPVRPLCYRAIESQW